MLWIGIHFPHLALDAFLRALPSCGAGTPQPMAVCRGGLIEQACPEAMRHGLQPGMKRATAQALLPGLLLRERDPDLERDTLAQAAAWALRFTPAVSLQQAALPTGPDDATGLLLEVAGSLRLFDGLQPLLGQVRAGLAQLGLQPSIGCAPTATGAWLMARYRDGLSATDPAALQTILPGLPLSVLDSAAPHLEVLASLGAQRIEQLSLLPRAGLARRFGPQLLRELDRAWGRAPEPRTWFVAPPTFTARLELPAAADDASALLAGARRLLSSLCGWLNARHAAAQTVTLNAAHDDPPATVITLQPADPTADEERLAVLLRERLAVTRLRAPVHTLRIDCDRVVPAAPGNSELFPMPTPARESIARLIEQLQARLGRDRVLRLAPQADHRPEAACRLERATIDALSAAAASRTTEEMLPAGGALPRPTWLLAQPQPLAERQQRPWLGGPLMLLAGPERIETGWWDGNLVQRDYFIAADDDGLLLWIYRERPGQARTDGGWFLQGRYG